MRHVSTSTRTRDTFVAAMLALTLLVLVPSSALAATTFRVDPADPGAYHTIASAVASASAGDVVLVAPGRYPESLTLKSGVEIRAVASTTPVLLDGEGIRQPLTAAGVAEATVTGVVIANGRGAPDGGALASVGSTVALVDCVIKNGAASKGGAVFAVAAPGGPRGRVRIVNCSIVANVAGAGAAIWSAATPIGLANTITWGNGAVRRAELVGPVKATYSDVATAGTGNLDADPRFADSAHGDYSLVLGSPCVDTGSQTGAPTADIVGSPRPQDGDGDGRSIVDMGAYERPTFSGAQTRLSIAVNPSRVVFGGRVLVTGSLLSGATTLSGRSGVSVWSASSVRGPMSRVAAAAWDALHSRYVATVRPTANRWLQLRFSGEGTLCASRSETVAVSAGVLLGTPVIKGPVYRGGPFKVAGTLRPSEGGKVLLYFYRQQGQRAQWRLYGHPLKATLARGRALARYSLTVRLPDAGAWCVKAFRADSGHASTFSSPAFFTVDLFPSGRFIFPVAGKCSFTNDWGAPRSGGRSHEAIDIMAGFGTPAVAVVAGSVTTKEGGLAGKSTWLTGKDGIQYFYAHLQGWAVRSGHVRAGQVVGYVGNTGNASGGAPHLHFGIMINGSWVNPYRTLLAARRVHAPSRKPRPSTPVHTATLSQPAIVPSSPHRARNFHVTGTLAPGARAWVRLYFYRQRAGKWVMLRAARVRAMVVKAKGSARYDSRNRIALPGRYYVRAWYAAKGRRAVYSKIKYFRVR